MRLAKLLGLFGSISLFLLLVSSGVRADSVYNFDSASGETSLSLSSNGITATFSSAVDPGGFAVGATFFSAPMVGNVLLDPGSANGSNLALDVLFSSDLQSITLDFAVDGLTSDTFDLAAYEGATLVGTSSATGTILSSFPQGTISFSGATFNKVTLTSSATEFAIDNVDVASIATPESPTALLLGAGLLALLGVVRRRRKAGEHVPAGGIPATI